MPQSEFVPVGWELESPLAKDLLALKSTSHGIDVRFTFEEIANQVFRTTFTSPDHPLPPWPSVRREDRATNGSTSNGNNSTTGTARSEISKTSKQYMMNEFILDLHWGTGPPLISVTSRDAVKTVVHCDLPHRGYVLDGSGIAHYTRYDRAALHVGLGEKAAPLDLSNRHFILSATDCFGYDVRRTDPMYKHVPLLITSTPEYAIATFSTSHSRGTYSVGSEIDGMWGRYKVYRQDHGGLEEYTIVGKTMQEVLRRYADLVGYPLLVPRWAFGYLAGGMKYSMLDEPSASEALMGFADKLKEHDIPCSGFQLSSGYTVAESEPKTRNVFTWNKHRFRDPKAFVNAYHAQGIRLIANVKPYVLDSHPEYTRLRDAGAFFSDPRTGKSAEARLWSAGGGESGIGGHIDFTSRAGYDFWYSGVKDLRKLGIDCIWNDNNEYTIPDDNWQCALDPDIIDTTSTSVDSNNVGLWGRYINTELMGKASHDAVVEVRPAERPFILTRAATAGTMRYCASSWSGDNVTSWESMKGANALSLTASMSLLHCYGHDIGGFEGPQPSPELLLRWVQFGVHSQRFAINCFKTSPADNSVGDVIEPWMYPEITHLVRKAIKRRYELIPYLYSLMLRSHLYAEPPVRWTGWDYCQDKEVWANQVLREGETQYFLGDTLLVGGVYEAGGQTAKMYLPSSRETSVGEVKEQFLNLNEPYQYLDAGRWVDITSLWQQNIPVLAKVGTLIPVGRAVQVRSSLADPDSADLPMDDYRAVELFPPPESSERSPHFTNSWLEDDGISPAPANILKIELSYSCEGRFVDITAYKHIAMEDDKGAFEPLWKELHFILPVGDRRVMRIRGCELPAASEGRDNDERSRFCARLKLLLDESS